MAKYNMQSHYTHEVDEKYKSGWDSIFAKKQEGTGPSEKDTPPKSSFVQKKDSLP